MTGSDNPFSVCDVEHHEVILHNTVDSDDQSFQSVGNISDQSEGEWEVEESVNDSDVYTSTPLTHYTDATYDVDNVRRRLFTSTENLEVNIDAVYL